MCVSDSHRHHEMQRINDFNTTIVPVDFHLGPPRNPHGFVEFSELHHGCHLVIPLTSLCQLDPILVDLFVQCVLCIYDFQHLLRHFRQAQHSHFSSSFQLLETR